MSIDLKEFGAQLTRDAIDAKSWREWYETLNRYNLSISILNEIDKERIALKETLTIKDREDDVIIFCKTIEKPVGAIGYNLTKKGLLLTEKEE